MSEQPDTEAEERLTTLGRAIAAAFPDEYVDGWILITHRRSTELEQQGTSIVGATVPDNQNWVLTRGMFEIAADSDVFSTHSDDDEDDD